MEAHQVLGEVLCRLQYVGRNPSMAEYKAGSPAEQRAIINRWREILNKTPATVEEGEQVLRAALCLGRAES